MNSASTNILVCISLDCISEIKFASSQGIRMLNFGLQGQSGSINLYFPFNGKEPCGSIVIVFFHLD